MTWSIIALFMAVIVTRQSRELFESIHRPRVIGMYLLAAALIASNWFVFIWAVNAGHIIESSLGYFIVPLVSVILGVLFLNERLRPWQWVSVGLAGVGVLYLTIVYGAVPWIALALAISFGLYGLVKKKAQLSSIPGLTLETALMLLPAILYLGYVYQSQGVLFPKDPATTALLVASGVITTVPLLLFSAAAQRIPLTYIGLLQYLSPTLQFLLGFALYREAFSQARLVGYCVVWAALVIFVVEGLSAQRKRHA